MKRSVQFKKKIFYVSDIVVSLKKKIFLTKEELPYIVGLRKALVCQHGPAQRTRRQVMLLYICVLKPSDNNLFVLLLIKITDKMEILIVLYC